MEALAEKSLEVVHITAIKWDDDEATGHAGIRISEGETGSRLSSCAASVGIPFFYEEIRLHHLQQHLVCEEDTALVFNVMVELPHMMCQRSKAQILDFLSVARGLRPAIVTLASAGVETELGDCASHLNKTVEYYSALLESLEAGLPDMALARMVMEHIFMAPKIQRTVSASQSNDKKLISGKMYELPGMCGFSGEGVQISEFNMAQARELLAFSRGCDYRVEMEGAKNRAVLKWRNTPLVSVSTWR